MKKLKTILQSRYLFKILAIIFILISLGINYFTLPSSKYSKEEKKITGKVILLEIDGNKSTIHLKGKEKILVKYYFVSQEEKQYYQKNLKLGDKISITGTLEQPKKNTTPNGFNYQKYLQRKRIYYIAYANKLQKIENNTSILYYLKNKMIERMDQIDKTGYMRTFILGDKSLLDEETLQNYQKNGISHLFSISGMHVSLIVGIILSLLNRISYNNLYKYSISNIILFFYVFLTDCSASILRTTIMFLLFSINKCFSLKIRKIDIMLLTLIIAIIINPFILYDIGFQFSYLTSLTLVIFTQKIKSKKNYLIRNFYLSSICFLVSFPICIYYFYQVNTISIFLNIIMIPLVSFLIFPLTLLTFVFRILQPFYEVTIIILEKINNVVGNINTFEFIFSKPSIVIIILYYILIYLTLYKKEWLFLLLIVMIIHHAYPYYDDHLIATVQDVGQGDAILIKFPYNKGNVLIDTGGTIQKRKENWEQPKQEYSIATDQTIPYLKSLGINSVDYMILTHGDYDHIGEAINLVTNFKVNKIIFNCGEYNDLENELISVLEKKHIKYHSCIKELKMDEYKLHFLDTKEYDSENDNSNVIYLKFHNYKFLFMGDAGVGKEKDILEKYNLENVDFLKVGHHGSNTSSSKEFIENINPKYSLISVGKNNRYGHPKDSVLSILKDSKVYRTDLDGSIEIKLNKRGYKIRTCSP